MRPQNKT